MSDFLSGLGLVVGFSIAMFAGCMLAGYLPLALSLPEEKIHLMNALGAGLLLGTALSVIIPEGVHTIVGAGGHDHDHDADHGHDDGHDLVPSYESYIGIMITAGFLFQLILEKVIFVDNHIHSHSSSDPVSANEGTATPGPKHNMATLGLIIHSAADGFAVAAAVIASQSSMEYLILIALMLHKAPAAFGLSSYLLANKIEKRHIREHLIAFAVAAPLTAILAYIILYVYTTDKSSTTPIAGMALLFSGGTFLYVSTMHVLPELDQNNHSHKPSSSTSSTPSSSGDLNSDIENPHHKNSKGGIGRNPMIALVIGMILPAILSMNHHH